MGSNRLKHQSEKDIEIESRIRVEKKCYGQLLMSVWAWKRGTEGCVIYVCSL